MTENPFVYGEVVPRSAFVGREVELARLSADLADGQKIFLISPRRYGKSSLIAQAFASLGRRRIATHVKDCTDPLGVRCSWRRAPARANPASTSGSCSRPVRRA